jgi:hypothetical protein
MCARYEYWRQRPVYGGVTNSITNSNYIDKNNKTGKTTANGNSCAFERLKSPIKI